MADVDQRERASLCDLFLDLGPEAPTLCGDWRTADLAAHLVVRERNLLAGPGILLGGPLGSVTERLMARELERHGYEGVVERIRSGPPLGPMAIRPLGRMVNTVEYVVHHEDVRRPAGLGPRTDDADLQRTVADLLRRGARYFTARAHLGPAGLSFEWPDGEPVVAHGAGADGSATLAGDPVEILLYIQGRKLDAEVELSGDPAAVIAVENASFGI